MKCSVKKRGKNCIYPFSSDYNIQIEQGRDRFIFWILWGPEYWLMILNKFRNDLILWESTYTGRKIKIEEVVLSNIHYFFSIVVAESLNSDNCQMFIQSWIMNVRNVIVILFFLLRVAYFISHRQFLIVAREQLNS